MSVCVPHVTILFSCSCTFSYILCAPQSLSKPLLWLVALLLGLLDFHAHRIISPLSSIAQRNRARQIVLSEIPLILLEKKKKIHFTNAKKASDNTCLRLQFPRRGRPLGRRNLRCPALEGPQIRLGSRGCRRGLLPERRAERCQLRKCPHPVLWAPSRRFPALRHQERRPPSAPNRRHPEAQNSSRKVPLLAFLLLLRRRPVASPQLRQRVKSPPRRLASRRCLLAVRARRSARSPL